VVPTNKYWPNLFRQNSSLEDENLFCLNNPGFREALKKYLENELPVIAAAPATVGLILWDRTETGTQGCYNPYTIAAYDEWAERRRQREITIPLHGNLEKREGEDSSGTGKPISVPRKREPAHNDGKAPSVLEEAEAEAWHEWVRFNRVNAWEFLSWLNTIFRQKASGTLLTVRKDDGDWGRDFFASPTLNLLKPQEDLVMAANEAIYGVVQEIESHSKVWKQ